ncbi:MAG: zinc dependent phospholipase C family protein [Candidatus Solibacter usitatus]|nr:zinc dependent phospholipase C family protein [Candidatus Solibacter usitatus]
MRFGKWVDLVNKVSVSLLDWARGPVRSKLRAAGRLTALLLASASAFYGYSVLTHEAIVDSLWDVSIQKMLLKRFPLSTPEELQKAHAYVYGGCILQDMGYYPFSTRLFSDLTHYVRSGDFVIALIGEAQNLNEYAFALGALAHYSADNIGHRIATNLAVPILYPKLRTRFGQIVTYWDNPTSHLRTEFGFDVLQVAQGRYAPDRYRAFIGFEVAKPVLERAFRNTYGLEMKDVFGHLDLALGSFRYSVSSIIPGMTRVAWQLKKDTLLKEIPGVTRKKFLFNLSRASYEKEWGTEYHRPGIRTRIVAWLLRVVPKFGPFKSLAFRAPTPEVERMFMASFNATVDSYRASLANVDAGRLQLANENFDVGAPTLAGQYLGTDQAYDKLLSKIAEHKFAGVSADLRRNILDYYKDRKPLSQETKKARSDWAKLLAQRAQLEQFQPETASPQ